MPLYNEAGNKNVVVEISNPQIENGTITFSVRLLEGNISNSFSSASLYIDSTDSSSLLPDNIRES